MVWAYSDLIQWINNGCDSIAAKCVTCLEIYWVTEMVIPDEIELLINLETLYITDCIGVTLPLSIKKLVKLDCIIICRCDLTFIPDKIELLINLETLYITDCIGVTLPLSIKKLVKLDCIIICRCDLTFIPDVLFDITSLCTLCVADNKITDIPLKLQQLVNLDRFYYNNNNIDIISPDVANIIYQIWCRKEITDKKKRRTIENIMKLITDYLIRVIKEEKELVCFLSVVIK